MAVRQAWRRSWPGEQETRPSPAAAADDLTAEALRSFARGDTVTFETLVALLTGRPEAPEGDTARWRLTADRCLATRLRRAVTMAWDRGWQPADVVRYASRRHTSRHGRLLTDAIASELRACSAADIDHQWHEQLAVLAAKVWWEDDDAHPELWCEREGVERAVYVASVLELVHLLENVPRLPSLGPPPGASTGTGARNTGSTDQRMLGRVRALLAKAESTEYPEEAEALSARAQELMARHSIDDALLAAETGDTRGPAGRRIPVDSPYDAPKAVLLTVVADANRCRAVWHRDLGFSTVLGFPTDLAAVEMLFTSLLVQATSAMVHAGPRRDARGRSRTRSFRHAFLNAYAARIGERLHEAAHRAAAGAGGKDLLPVLAARDRAVDEAVDTMFPNLAKGRAGSVSNYEGWVAGRAAADLASLNGRLEVTGAFRRS
ncbi:uncharacterized protein DUF2786 [Actinomadura pelletieri DSM 43383]|uniref:Uncharacterized protein DUF2786 n=1 Tax=Actinomadura pelletieri DSM 43383 TaxID=1120940 RepID=A0A495QMM2_9ACTN|nr:DUF2786 domain-containing protein [Actinomadura pelletieri]RKS74235.1 uncharacterized protein DUF2786 [Actinomadura pelletieri DSM 43383]